MPKGPLGEPRFTSIGPFVEEEKGLVTELENAIGDESSAEKEYQRLIDLLEKNGYDDMAGRVREIQQEEIDHRRQFKNMLSEIRRE